MLAVSAPSYFYIMAFKYAPATHVELIMYIWPMIVIIGNVLFYHGGLARSRGRQLPCTEVFTLWKKAHIRQDVGRANSAVT